MVFEKGLLKEIFGLRKEEATGVCRKLHSEELHNL
jgi:hypothetical protein